jgi:hypothetical protein
MGGRSRFLSGKLLGIREKLRGLHAARNHLIAEAGFHRDPFAPFSAAAGQYLLAALGLHARAKSMCLDSLAPVGLECTLGHEI